MIYLDYQATTPMAPEVTQAMQAWLGDNFWNPHSAHRGGRIAAASVEVARNEVARLLPDGGQLVFTSGATEALNMALIGAMRAAPSGRNRIVTIATEHAAVLDTARFLEGEGYALTVLPVDAHGLVNLDSVESAMADDVALLAAMQVNNEIGVIQPVEAMARLAHDAGALVLSDCVQGYGRIETPASADMIALSGHKIHGPKGVGALWLRDGVTLAPLIHGGGQEAGLRSGTLSPALCVGLGTAAKLAREQMEHDSAHVDALWAVARDAFSKWTLNGSADMRYHGNLNIRRDDIDAARLVSDVREVLFSVGSACASGSGRPSHVLSALGLDDSQARASIRLGFGRYTRLADIEKAAALINEAADRQQEYL